MLSAPGLSVPVNPRRSTAARVPAGALLTAMGCALPAQFQSQLQVFRNAVVNTFMPRKYVPVARKVQQ